MMTEETLALEPLAVAKENIIHLPLGLLGFEKIKKYVLLSNPEEEPFHWLQVLDDPSLAFVVVPPFAVVPDYRPDLTPEDVEFLGLTAPADALLYNIVTLRGPKGATVNLKGPIVLNRFSLRGRQIVLANAADYSLHHPLPLLNS